MSRAGRELRDAFRRLLAAQSVLDEAKRPCGAQLSQPHAHALLVLREATGSLRVNELADELSIDRTNVSRLCARMEELGEIERASSATDRRARAIQLTPRGRTLADHVDESSEGYFSEVASGLGGREGEVAKSLERLRATIARVRISREGTDER